MKTENRFRSPAMTRTSTSPRTNDLLIAPLDDADEGVVATDGERGRALGSDDFDEQVQLAQEQLLHLRHQQQLIERQKAEIEELKVRRREFLEGRSQLVDKLGRATVVLERETYEAQKKAEQFLHTKIAFERHLDAIEAIDPEDWSRSELRAELARALGIIDDARTEYQKAMARMHSLIDEADGDAPVPFDDADAASARNPIAEATLDMAAEGSAGAADARDFGYWFRTGFAFTLPVILFGLFALLVQLLFG